MNNTNYLASKTILSHICDDEVMNDFISLVTSFCNRIYGRRRKDKTNQIIKDITNETQEK